MEQTAVEFLIEKLFDVSYYTKRQIDMFKKAKEMEKEQIIDFAYYFRHEEVNKKEIEQYYNEKFKK